MGRIHRYCSALSRYHKSNGFGIHSPFAFKFVLNVLRERLPYYSYSEIDALRKKILTEAKAYSRHTRIMSKKNAKMVFRVVNYFNPDNILQIGSNYGMSSACMLMVSSHSHLTLYEPQIADLKVLADVIAPYGERISMKTDMAEAIGSYRCKVAANPKFVLINSVSETDYDMLVAFLKDIIRDSGVVIMRNLSRSHKMAKLFKELSETAEFGMTFTNEKIAFFVSNPKLPHQVFQLWF